MNYDLKGFGEKLVSIRESMKLSQRDVKNLIGVNEDTLRKAENGYVVPRIDTMDKLSIVYKCDIYLLFSSYRLTFDNYVTTRIKEHAKDFKNYDYEKLRLEAESFREAFKDNKYYNDEIILKKKEQYYVYLMSLHNINNSFEDISRKDLSKLFEVLDFGINDFYKSPEDIYFDKLEMLILLLISIIYRYINEFDNSKVIIERIEKVLEDSHKNDPDYMYYLVLVIYNKMTLHNRNNDIESIMKLFEKFMIVFDDNINNQNFLTLLMRVGLGGLQLDQPGSKELVISSINLLDQYVNHNLAEKYRNIVKKNYAKFKVF